MHLPEFALRARALGGLRGQQRVRVDFFQREMAESKTHAPCESLQQQLDRRRGQLAVRAFEVAVLHDDDASVLRAKHVVDRAHGLGEIGGVALHAATLHRNRSADLRPRVFGYTNSASSHLAGKESVATTRLQGGDSSSDTYCYP